MSLKAVHIFFILAAISLCVFFGRWALSAETANVEGGGRTVGMIAFSIAALLLVYLVWFVMKIRNGKLQ